MRFTYKNISTAELHGTRLEELLINIEADVTIADDDGTVVFAEPEFPITELARDLIMWAACGSAAPTENFEWDSMSFAELGAIRICEGESGWQLGSAYAPDTWSKPLSWPSLRVSIRDYVKRVRADVEALGIDPSFVPTPEELEE